MIKSLTLIFVSFTFCLISSIRGSENGKPKWNSPTIYTRENHLLRQASVVGFADISFDLGRYFLKVFDGKCNSGNSEKHKELVERASHINKEIHKYVMDVIKDDNLASQIYVTGEMIESIRYHFESSDINDSVTIKDLHETIKQFRNLLLKSNAPVNDDNFLKQFFLQLKSHEKNKNCEIHSSGRALATGFIMSSLIACLQMARIELLLYKTKKNQAYWNDLKTIYKGFLNDFHDSIYAAAINGTKSTFSCRNDKQEELRESYKIFTGKVEATNDNVIAGVRFKIESNTLFIQIKEGKLLPFGQVKPEKNWKSVKPSNRDTTQFNSQCHFILSRQHVSPKQVLVGVQIRRFEEWESEKCFYTIVAHGRKADLLEGNLHHYRSQFFVSRPIHTYGEVKTITNNGKVYAEVLNGSNVQAAGLPFKKKGNAITPRIETQDIETTPATAHGGVEVFATYQKDVLLLRLRLYSVNIAKHLGSFLQLEEYPEYYYSD